MHPMQSEGAGYYAEGLRKTLPSNNKSHSGNIRAVVDHHAYYVTNKKTGISEETTAITTTLVGRKKPIGKKCLYRRNSVYPKKSINIQREKCN